jgi:hypothetical protein
VRESFRLVEDSVHVEEVAQEDGDVEGVIEDVEEEEVESAVVV